MTARKISAWKKYIILQFSHEEALRKMGNALPNVWANVEKENCFLLRIGHSVKQISSWIFVLIFYYAYNVDPPLPLQKIKTK